MRSPRHEADHEEAIRHHRMAMCVVHVDRAWFEYPDDDADIKAALDRVRDLVKARMAAMDETPEQKEIA